ncbi:MAG: non-ribosomal peptide synthase/polyketide synthase [Deltaproteobacteria bacterium]|nr:non-ribosomal peptide synthase/polyketide synthase [Deltaproteobacteria bacterium]
MGGDSAVGDQTGGGRVYRTGDRARWLADGRLEFLGRQDAQIKIRGFRVEPGEVEAALAGHRMVKAVAVVPQALEAGGYRLAAFYVAESSPDAAQTPVLESATLRAYLKESLPDYMTPASWELLDQLPLTANGKVDRAALRERAGQQEVSGEASSASYRAPRSPHEESLATIFAEVLGVPRVGLDDDFFALGGDSILSLQIVSRAKRAGLSLTPRQVFESPTVGALALLVGTVKIAAEQGLVEGEGPLLPIQRWFLEAGLESRHHTNLPLLLEPAQDLAPGPLGRSLHLLSHQHDALRASFRRERGRWRQHFEAPGATPHFLAVDLSALSPEAQDGMLLALGEQIQGSFQVEDGGLFRGLLADLGEARGQRLLLVAHHLVVDNLSWQIVVEDLAAIYPAVAAGKKVELPAKTTSFKEWGERLQGLARGEIALQEGAYWSDSRRLDVPPLPTDFEIEGAGSETSSRVATAELTVEETDNLLAPAQLPYRTRVEEMLVTALARAARDWSGSGRLVVDLEGHGREQLFEDVDLSRTVGWFSTLYPLLLDIGDAPGDVSDEGQDFAAGLKAVKEEMRRLPGKGIGHGVLRWMGDDATATPLATASPPQILFNYQGRLEEGGSDDLPFRMATEKVGLASGPDAQRTHLIQVDAALVEGRLKVSWVYSLEVHRPQTLESLAEAFGSQLRGLITHCLSPQAGGWTPSDFPLANLEEASLATLVAAAPRLEDIYPLSPLQQGMLFHTVYEPEEGTYVGQLGSELASRVDREAFEAAWQALLQRHPVLRTSFHYEGLEEPLQVVHERVTSPVGFEDWSGLAAAQQEDKRQEFLARDRRRGFSLTEAPLVRLQLIRLAEASHRLVWSYHQMLVDGWSLPRLFQEFLTSYEALRQQSSHHQKVGQQESGQQDQLGQLPAPPPFREYIAWLRDQDLVAAEAYWRGLLEGFSQETPIPFDRPFADQRRHAEAFHSLAPESTSAIQAAARRQRVTLNTLVQAAWGVLLGRYGGLRDVVFGVTVSGRPAELDGVEDMVGLFINTLPFRAHWGHQAVGDWLPELQSQQVEMGRYEYTPLAEIQRWSELGQGKTLFDSFLVFQNYPFDGGGGEAQEASSLGAGGTETEERSNYALTLVVFPGAQLVLDVEYDLARHDTTTIQRLLRHLEVLLGALAEKPQLPVDQLPLTTAAETHQLLVEWSTTEGPVVPGLFLDRFSAQVTQQPDATAVLCGERELTFAQLTERSRSLAHRLEAAGVGQGSVVGLCTERSVEMVVGLLGILQAGGAYLPLDPAYPADRLRWMVADCAASWVVAGPGSIDFPNVQTVGLTSEDSISESVPAGSRRSMDPRQPAYLIYTSGSTGLPKGVVVSHGSMATYTGEMVRQWRLSARDRFLQFASLSFDVVVEEVFPALEAGGAVVVPQGDLLLSVPDLIDILERHGATCAELPAAYWQEWVGQIAEGESRVPESLRLLLLGCEKPSARRLDQWRQAVGSQVDLRIVFGLTETTITNTLHRWEPEVWDGASELPIGRPVAHSQLWVVDEALRPVPAGVVGELYVGGSGIAQGYWGRSGLTASRFVPDTWSQDPKAQGGERAYRTGDRARWRADGRLEFLGRQDAQIKIRGFRVEPGEVEAALLIHDQVKEVAVMARAVASGGHRLVAFVVSENEQTLEVTALRSHLGERLPEYMIPSFWEFLHGLPLTANGKVDRAALGARELAGSDAERGYRPPRTPAEQILAAAFGEVLGVERVGLDDDFFELGGDSILSLQITSRALKQGLHLTPRQVFENSTVEELARMAASARQILTEAEAYAGPVALLPIQRWFLEAGLESRHHTNLPVMLAVREPLSHSLVERALVGLMTQHQALRLRFEEGDDGWRGFAEAPKTVPVPLTAVDLSHLSSADLFPEKRAGALEQVCDDLQSSLQVGQAPLWRAALVDLGDGGQRLFLVMHHLIMDNVSLNLLAEDLEASCRGLLAGGDLETSPPSTSPRQWAERLVERTQAGGYASALPYWSSEARQQVAALPLDFPHGVNSEASGRTLTVTLDQEETRQLLQEVPGAYRTQLDEVLLTAIAEALAAWTGSAATVVDREGHGREEEEFGDVSLARTVGWLATLYPVLLDLRSADGPGEAIKAVKEQLRGVPHRGLSHGLLRDYGPPEARQALAALPAAPLLYNNLGQLDGASPTAAEPGAQPDLAASEANQQLFRLSDEAPGRSSGADALRTHPLEVEVAVSDGRLRVSWDYSANLHKASTVEKLAEDFRSRLVGLIAHCVSPEAGGWTPSDFPLATLTQGQVDELTGSGELVEDIYPLSPLQQGMLFHTLYDPDEGTYVGQLGSVFHQEVSREAFETAWQGLLARHGVLRTSFCWQGLDEPLQLVHSQVSSAVAFEDWSTFEEEEQEQRRLAYLAADRSRGFDMGQAPLMRLMVARLGEASFRLVWSYHQMLVDGWSLPRLFEEFLASYEAARKGKVLELPSPPPFREYIAWLQRQDLPLAEKYWRGRLEGFSEATPITFDRRQSEGRIYAEELRVLSVEQTHAVQSFARSHRLTQNTLVQGAWGVLLGRYAGNQDVIFGVTVSGRPAELDGVEDMVGLFINTLPFRARWQGQPQQATAHQVPAPQVPAPQVPAPQRAVATWLEELQSQQIDMGQVEYTPLAEIQKWSELPAGETLFDSFLVFQNYPLDTGKSEEPEASSLGAGGTDTEERSSYALTLVVYPGSELVLDLEYDASRHDATTIHRMLGHMEVLLSAMAAQPDRSVADLPLLSTAEAHQLRWEWTATDRANPAGLFLDRFAAQTAATPAATAVLCGDQQLTFGQLQDQAQRLALRLQAAGVGPGSVVGLCTERSREMVVGLLGILQAGGAYLPLDPSYPEDRLQFMVQDSAAAMVVAGPGAADFPSVQSIALDLKAGRESDLEAGDPNLSRGLDSAVLSPHQPAYVIYTSGSTGTPKGVVVSHASLASYTTEMVRQWRLGASDRFLQFASLSFDVVVEEIFPALESGGAVVVPQGDLLLSVESLVAVLEEHGVTCAELPAAYWQEWVAQITAGESRVPESLRLLLLGCEKPAVGRLAQWREAVGSRVDVRVVFGLTETTITNTLERWQPARWDGVTELPIGPPVSNTRLWVVEESSGEASGGTQRPVPLGVVGELYVGGSGVAQGYLGRPALTASRFVPDGWSDAVSGDSAVGDKTGGGRVYRTGDRARWLADGRLEFLGRQDAQIKIRGFRVEPGEVEAVLAGHRMVKAVAVVPQAMEAGGYRLAAFLVPEPLAEPAAGPSPDAGALRAYLKERLPDYMTPASWDFLDQLPLTANGKVDRAALAARKTSSTQPSEAYRPPRSEVEKVLARAFEEVLGVERVSLGDDFFELGGDSILSLQIASRALREGLHLTPRQIFEHSTVEELAAVAASARQILTEDKPYVGAVTLLPIQRWFLEVGLESRHHTNLPVLLELSRPLPFTVVQRVLAALTAQHEALRLRFEVQEHGWGGFAQAPEATPVPLTQVDLSQLPKAQHGPALEKVCDDLQGSLDVAVAPLWRAALVNLGDGGQRLFLVLHHLIMDNVSMNVLAEDLEAGCQSLLAGGRLETPPKTTSVRQWAERLVEHTEAGGYEASLPYWIAAANPEGAALPLDFEDGVNSEASTKTVTVELTTEETRQLLQEVPKAYRTRLDEVLLAAVVDSIGGWTGSAVTVVDREGHGREEEGFADISLARTVGWLATLYPVLLDARQGEGPGEILKRVKEQLRGVPDRGLSYGLLRDHGSTEAREALGSASGATAGTAKTPPILYNNLGLLDGGQPDTDQPGADQPDAEAPEPQAQRLFRPSSEASGRSSGADALRTHLLEVEAAVSGGRLRVTWDYSPNLHRPETVEALAKSFQGSLRRLIEHCLSPEAGGFTPSDFPLATLKQETVDELAAAAPHLEDAYPLSPLQQGMLFHTLYEPDEGTYVGQLGSVFHSEVDLDAFANAWRQLLLRHPVLRTSFHWQGLDEPLQMVHGEVDSQVGFEDWGHLAAEQQDQRLETYLAEDRRRGFDLGQPPLMRLQVLRLAEARFRLVWSYHQLLVDGWSLPRLFEEFSLSYQAHRRKELDQPETAHPEPVQLPAPPPFRDYIAWLRRQDMAAAEEYWTARLEGFSEETPIAFDRGPGEVRVYGETTREVDRGATAKLQAFARAQRLTQNSLVQGAWGLLLGRYSGLRDVVFGVTVSGRPAELQGVEDMVGLFINTLPFRARWQHQTVGSWLEELQDQQMEMGRFEYTPLAEIQRWSALPAGEALFDSFLVFQNYPLDGGANEASEGSPEEAAANGDTDLGAQGTGTEERSNFALTLVAYPGTRLGLDLEYDAQRHDSTTIERMLRHLEVLLNGMAEDASRPVTELPLLTAAESHQLEVEWAATERAPAPGLFLDRFARRVEEAPEALAVTCGSGRLTYRQLAAASTSLAVRLEAAGVRPGDVVGLCTERSLGMVVGLLGILQAGAAYLPLDPDYPLDRLQWMVQDSCARLVLRGPEAPDFRSESETDPEADSAIGRTPVETLSLEAPAKEPAAVLASPSATISRHQAAYVIYTSGSTGQPKGVVVSHGSLAAYCEEMVRQWRLSPVDRFLQFASLSFDVVVEEVFPVLEAGGSVVVPEGDLLLALGSLVEVMETQGVTCAELPSAYWQEWVSQVETGESRVPESLRLLLLGCEKPSPRRLSQWRQAVGSRVDVRVVFGLTETTITNTLHRWEVDRWDGLRELPIGRPVANTHLSVVDRDRRSVPVGVVGELYVGGEGVAQGYLGRPGLTASRFVPMAASPHRADRSYRSYRSYRTGDRARWLWDGSLEFLGRQDDQVKIRGFRVEPGEVEAALLSHEAVKEVAVVPREQASGNLRLVAFVVVEGGPEARKPEGSALRSHLKELVPDYMAPAIWEFLPHLPLTSHGKVDRRELGQRELSASEVERSYRPPRTAAEQALAEAFADVLGVDRVGLDDDFFELGGDSILSLQIASRVLRAGFHLTPRQIFEFPTVEELAGTLALALQILTEEHPYAGPVALLPIQRWFLEAGLESRHHTNLPVMLQVGQALPHTVPYSVIERVLASLTAQHEALRLGFREEEDGWAGFALAPEETKLPLTRVDLSHLASEKNPTAQDEALERLCDRLQGSLQVGAPPLWRAALVELGEERGQRLFLVMHHLIMDNVSMDVLAEDLERGCRGLLAGGALEAAPKTTSIRQWAERLVAETRAGAFDPSLAYWAAEARRAVAPLPVDFESGVNSEASTRTVTVTLEAEETRQLLQEVPKAYRTQLDEVLLTAVTLALGSWAVGSWTGSPLALVDREGHGREEEGFSDISLARTVGWLATLYPVLLDLRSSWEPEKSDEPEERGRTREYGEALKLAKEQLRSVPDRGLSHGLLRDYGSEAIRETFGSLAAAPILYNNLGRIDGGPQGGAELEGGAIERVQDGAPDAAGDAGTAGEKAPTPEIPANEGPLFHRSGEATGRSSGDDALRTHLLEIEAAVSGDRLQVTWDYSANLHRGETIEALAENFRSQLRQLIAHCLSPQAGGFTPSDFPLARLDRARLDRARLDRARPGQGSSSQGGPSRALLSQQQVDQLAASAPDLEDVYPLSPLQQGMLFHALYEPEEGFYIGQLSTGFQGQLDHEAFRQTWQRLLRRHTALRSTFRWQELEAPLQVVHEDPQIPFRVEDWRDLEAEQRGEKLQDYLRTDRAEGFDLQRAPLMRVLLVRVEDELYQLVWSFHQMLLDGWSLGLVFEEFYALYEAARQGKDLALPEPPPFRDFIAWLESQDRDGAEEFWRQELAGFASPTPLAADFPASGSGAREGEHLELSRDLPAELSRRIDAHVRRQRMTLNTFVQGAWALWLGRQAMADEVVFGATVSGRPPELVGVEDMVGAFINTLPVRVPLPPLEKVGAWLEGQQERTSRLQQYEYSSLGEIQRCSEVPQAESLFHSLMVFQNHPGARTGGGEEGAPAQPSEAAISVGEASTEERSNFALTLVVNPGEELNLELAYDSGSFENTTLARALESLESLLDQLLESDRTLAELSVLSAAQRHQLTVEWSVEGAGEVAAGSMDSSVPVRPSVPSQQDGEAFITDRLSHHSFQQPSAVALEFGDESLTYGELEGRVAQLTGRLVAILASREMEIEVDAGAGIGSDQEPTERLVGICLERSFDMVVATLATLRAGAAFVPLDPAYPQQRLEFLVRDSGLTALISRKSLLDGLDLDLGFGLEDSVDSGDSERTAEQAAEESTPAIQLLDLDAPPPAMPTSQTELEAAGDVETPEVSPGDLAYVIYTSGTTGTPKGVLVERGSLTHTLAAAQQRFGFRGDDRILYLAPFSFDISLFESLAVLAAGGTVRILERQEILEMDRLLGRLREATVLHAVPTLMRQLVDAVGSLEPPSLESLRRIFVGGDRVPSPLLGDLQRAFPSARVEVLYGPTEATIICASFPVPRPWEGGVGFAANPIGRPLPGSHLEILDAHRSPVALGVPGELAVAGPGVARGYLGRPELSAESFVEIRGRRFYRTGDKVRWNGCGGLEFLGRVDEQVKIRGFRIEPGEIEAQLEAHGSVGQSVVVAHRFDSSSGREAGSETGDLRLVAYVAPPQGVDGGNRPTPGELRTYLEAHLPAHLVPALFVPLDSLPLSPTGKVDRRRLPEPQVGADQTIADYEAPRTEREQALAEVWKSVLKAEQVGLRDNYFELGGDSILSIQISSRAARAGIHITPRQIFEHPTVAALARVAGSAAIEAEQGLVEGPVTLLPIQRSFLEAAPVAPHHFTQRVLLEVRRTLEPRDAAAVVAAVLRQHDALRLRFEATENGWSAVGQGMPAQLPLYGVDLSALQEEHQAAQVEQVAAAMQKSLSLTGGELFTVTLMNLGAAPARLLVTAHHLVVDDVSWDALLEDLQQAYELSAAGKAVELPPKTTSFAAWSAKLAELAATEAWAEERDLWLEEGRRQVPPLPRDGAATTSPGEASLGAAETVERSLGEEPTGSLLHDVPPVYRTRIDEILLAALATAFAPWTGSRSLLVDIEGHGREEIFDDVDLTRTVGWFTAAYPALVALPPELAPELSRELAGEGDLGAGLLAVKEQLRAIPNRGLGYGLMRYLGPVDLQQQLAQLPAAEVLFNYAGQQQGEGEEPEAAGGEEPVFLIAREDAGAERSPEARREHSLEVLAEVRKGRLEVEWVFSPSLHRRQTVETLADAFMAALEALIAHCLLPSAGAVSAADFELANLDDEKLDVLSDALGDADEDDDDDDDDFDY